MTISRFSAVLACSLVLMSCSEKISDQGLICDDTPGWINDSAATSDGQLEIIKLCMIKWGYRYAKAPGSNTEIAKATIGRCRFSIDYLKALKIAEAEKRGVAFDEGEWGSLERRFDEMAIHRVVQGRAGNCSIRGADQQ